MKTKKTVALFPAHPAQLWFMLHLADVLYESMNIIWVLRDKDVTIEIARQKGLSYTCLSKASKGMLGNLVELCINIFKVCHLTRKHKIDLWLTKYGAGNIGAWLMGRKSISFNDDDIDIVPYIAMTSYPFASAIVAPDWTRMGKYNCKTRRVRSSMEYLYLHPSRFKPGSVTHEDSSLSSRGRFLLIRLSALTAHHDKGINGIAAQFIDELISRYQDTYRIYISSEKTLEERHTPFLLNVPAEKMHAVIADAGCLVTDSLTMALEASVLGVPSIRLSDFGNELSAFQAMTRFELIHNFLPDQHDAALDLLPGVLSETEAPGYREKKMNEVKKAFEDPLPVFVNAIRSAVSD